MQRFLRVATRTLVFAASAALAAYLVYHFLILPRLAPMQDYDFAYRYSRVLSQTTAADLAALSIRVPQKPTVLSQIDTRLLLQRLHDTGRFPEWKPSFRLLASRGRPMEFTILPTPPPADGSRELVQGDYTFAVKPASLPDPVQYP